MTDLTCIRVNFIDTVFVLLFQVVISTSQKTMNTAVSVIQFLPPSAGARGLLILPVLIAHFMQVSSLFVVSYSIARYYDANEFFI